ncbi:unnamed protein product [Calypogeia fissa]
MVRRMGFRSAPDCNIRKTSLDGAVAAANCPDAVPMVPTTALLVVGATGEEASTAPDIPKRFAQACAAAFSTNAGITASLRVGEGTVPSTVALLAVDLSIMVRRMGFRSAPDCNIRKTSLDGPIAAANCSDAISRVCKTGSESIPINENMLPKSE